MCVCVCVCVCVSTCLVCTCVHACVHTLECVCCLLIKYIFMYVSTHTCCDCIYLHACHVNLGEYPLPLPSGVTLSSDFMAWFCGESELAHSDTLSLMETVRYDITYLFAYSMRQVCCLLFVVY